MHGRSRTGAIASALAMVVAGAACSSGDGTDDTGDPGGADAEFYVEFSPVVGIDEPFEITVHGAAPGDEVTVTLSLQRADGTWVSTASFDADDEGKVALADAAPTNGDYEGVDPMGLFWSAQLQDDPVATAADPNVEAVIVTAEAGSQSASASVERFLATPGVWVRDVRDEGLVAALATPPEPGPHPGVLVLGGSDGGIAGPLETARVLSGHGYTAMALAYFDRAGMGGLPTQLASIPLEYVDTALAWLAAQSKVDPNRIGILGRSRGAELALLVAAEHPEVGAVVAYAPSSVAWPALRPASGPAWTRGGQPIPSMPPFVLGPPVDSIALFGGALDDPAAVAQAAIRVERIAGPVLLISGEDDQLWPSGRMAEAIAGRLPADRVEHLSYPGAGHVIPVPYQPTTNLAGTGPIRLGGEPAATAAASANHWPTVLQFLADNL